MDLSVSKRVQKSLLASPEFSSACAAVYADCLSLTQYAFSGVRPYQLFSAAERLHRTLSHSHSLRLISRWVPHPLDRAQVDLALKAISHRGAAVEEPTLLDEAEFKQFAAELFASAAASAARMEVLKRVPLGAVGITGVGAVFKTGKWALAVAIGTYALGVAASVYLSLDG